MRPLTPFLILLFLTVSLSQCGAPGNAVDGARPADSDWMADLQVTPLDTMVRLCGSGKRYRLTGPALDTIADRYRYANTHKGQWMKLWFSGHLGAVQEPDHVDSAIVAMSFQHIDASLRCDPIPEGRMTGSYRLEEQDPLHPRLIVLDLFDDGSAVMYTDLFNGEGNLEEDGAWGSDVDGIVQVTWPQRDQSMMFTWREGALESTKQFSGRNLIMDRIGPVDAENGSFGRVRRWIAYSAKQSGHPVDPSAIRPSSAIRSILASDTAYAAFRSSATDTLQLDSAAMKNQWPFVVTVKDAMRLMRRRMHRS